VYNFVRDKEPQPAGTPVFSRQTAPANDWENRDVGDLMREVKPRACLPDENAEFD
jgi:hypothetical protein